MCGIVGYTGPRDSVALLQEGLHRLEYRGYDSAGIAVLNGSGIQCVKSAGKLNALDSALEANRPTGTTGIGHTRWATHGSPTTRNAHPHLDSTGDIAIVHNGIIENYLEIRHALERDGVTFESDTDTESLVQLIRSCYDGDLFAAVKIALTKLRGAYALAVVARNHPGEIVAARQGGPLILGVSDGEMFVASDVAALLKQTRDVIYLEDGQIAHVRSDGYRIEDASGATQVPTVHHVDWDHEAAEKGGYPHFMLKEIYEQPEVLRRCIAAHRDEKSGLLRFPDLNLTNEQIAACDRLVIVACGTAYNAGLYAKYLFEHLLRIDVVVDIASEYRYREPIVRDTDIVVAVSQSGETTDTLEAVRVAKRGKARAIAILNVQGSTLARESDGAVYIHAGPEIGVASTKAYTAQMLALAMLAGHFARVRGTMDEAASGEYLDSVAKLPDQVAAALELARQVEELASAPIFENASSALFLARGFNYPNAFEGALKLKEISYVHAEGYGAGEMKHGAIALVTDRLPSICIAVESAQHDKMVSNIQELRARDGYVITLASEGDEEIHEHCDDLLFVPRCPEMLSPIVTAIPLQLLAYYVGLARECDVDQPRNLAKSVTVE